MATIVYPSNAELNEIAQIKLPRFMVDRVIFDIMVMANHDATTIMWEQKDNYIGMQQLRGINGQPTRVKPIGAKQYQMRPGIYGEFLDVDEQQMLERRQYGTFATPINLTDLVMERQDQLLQRRLDRIEYIGWTLLTTGTFSVALPSGGVAHTDTFPLQTSAGSNWSVPATATPLADLRAAKLLQRGKSTSFGRVATGYMNQSTANYLMMNTNQSDLAGKRQQGLAQPLSLADINTVLSGEDLPQLNIYDEGYYDDTGTFQLYIPTRTVVIVGRRQNGEPVAEYAMTRNANNPGFEPGPYMKIVDKGEDEVPRIVEVHDGHNGGPAIKYPGSVIILST